MKAKRTHYHPDVQQDFGKLCMALESNEVYFQVVLECKLLPPFVSQKSFHY
jgi:hypothetical protein